jgi:hypothetical protein
MIVTNSGRPVERFPLFHLRNGGKWLNFLSRVDVSDVGNDTIAEAFYTPLVVIQSEDQMTTVEVRLHRFVLVVFISPKKVNWHVVKPDQETEL